MIRYTIEITQYMENPKLSSSLRLKQIVGLLTNIAYVQDDCATRSNQILHEFITKAALQNREVETQVCIELVIQERGSILLTRVHFEW